MFRSELDALPIQEINEFEYRSKTDGVSHKCGHDGHTTVLIGLAHKLSAQRPYMGKVILLFQPSEENGEGAEGVLQDDRFTALSPDLVFAFHNLPGYPLHQIVYKKGSFTSSVISLIVKFHGKTSHAGEPELGYNPASAISKFIESALGYSNNEMSRNDFCVVTPIHINMGEKAYGISAGYGEVHLTIRCWTETELDKVRMKIKENAEQIAKQEGLTAIEEWLQHFNANQNSDATVDMVVKAAESNKISLNERAYPFKWGEDFGLFTQRYKGVMFGIGAGEHCPALHNPDYDFPDELLETGVNIFYSIIDQNLNTA